MSMNSFNIRFVKRNRVVNSHARQVSMAVRQYAKAHNMDAFVVRSLPSLLWRAKCEAGLIG